MAGAKSAKWGRIEFYCAQALIANVGEVFVRLKSLAENAIIREDKINKTFLNKLKHRRYRSMGI